MDMDWNRDIICKTAEPVTEIVMGVPQTFEPIFKHEDAEAIRARLKSELQAPVVGVQYSDLGGKEHGSFLVKISLDPKETWINGIYENSKNVGFHLENDGSLHTFMGWKVPKFRKRKVKTVDEAIAKINEYLELAKAS